MGIPLGLGSHIPLDVGGGAGRWGLTGEKCSLCLGFVL